MKTIRVGRSSSCDIVIDDDSVSRIHAEISLVNGQYVYKDISSNGTNLGGRMLHNESVVVAPGSTLLLSNRIPLPWSKVYAQLPQQGVRPFEGETKVTGIMSKDEGGLGVGWGILAFLIPVAGWIMYFCWKDDAPRKASQASSLAWVSFAIGFVLNLLLI